KLNNLNDNIKCGNSLIDDPNFEKAFNWQQEFPKVFAKGGFDVVIGNPPYVKEATSKQAFDGLREKECYQGKMDLWYFFGDLAFNIVKKETGLIGFIAPNNWITNDGASNFRNIVLEKGKIQQFIDFGDFKVFESAGIQTMIYIMSATFNNENYELDFSKVLNKKVKETDILNFLEKTKSDDFSYFSSTINKQKHKDKLIHFIDNHIDKILQKIRHKQNFTLNADEVYSGIDIGQDFVNKKSQQILGDDFNVGDGVFNLSNEEFKQYDFSETEKSIIKPFFTTNEINRHCSNEENVFWVIYTTSKFKNIDEIKSYPKLKEHLDKFQKIITSANKPYGLHRSRDEKIFLGNKILSIRKCQKPSFSFVDFDCYVNRTFNIIKTERINLSYLVCVLNSTLIKFWLKYKGKMQGDIFQVDMQPLINIPIKQAMEEKQAPFIAKAEQILQLHKDLQEVSGKFVRTIQRKFEELEKLPKKLENWYLLSFAEFVKELGKKKIKLSLSEETEWEDFF
ncbi:MAG: restriction endonuclease subunit M, partial [Fusobacteriales bacterium]